MPTHPIATQLLPVNQIHPNPDQPRKLFDLQAQTDLKTSIGKQGLINAISVMQRGEGDYLIIAGERRYRACSELGWKEIDARIWPSGTPASEVDLMSLVENLQRSDLTPLEVANGYKTLTLPPHNMTQEQLAEQSGKSRGTISQFLMIGSLEPQVREIANRLAKLELAHLLQICRLKTPEEQIEMAKKADNGGWTVKKLKREVDKKLIPSPYPIPKGRGPTAVGLPPMGEGSQRPDEGKVDPLADLWYSLKIKEGDIDGLWDVSFGHRVNQEMEELDPDGWNFWIRANTSTPKSRIKHILEVLINSLGDTNQEVEAQARKARKIQEPVGEIQRLPETEDDWNNVSAQAFYGPAAVYAWVFGKNSPMAKKTNALTWDSLGETDPIVGCENIIKQMKKVRSMASQHATSPKKDP
jgi:ParB family chromosome partitioning protein